MVNLDHKIPPPVVALLLAAVMWGVSWWTFSGATPDPLPQEGWRQAAVAVMGVVGLVLDLSGLWVFRRARTTFNPMSPAKATALVTGGVYRYTRNPMYVGQALLLSAWALHLALWWPWLGPVCFVLWIDRFQIAPEERVMRAKFGAEYEAYAARVRRWL